MNNIYVRLAKTNIQNNRQLYLPYIISGIVTVMMFYLMMFINNNPGLKSIPGSVNLKTIMALGVGIITIFAYIFIFIPIVSLANAGKKRLVCTISWVWKNDTLREFLGWKLFLWQCLSSQVVFYQVLYFPN